MADTQLVANQVGDRVFIHIDNHVIQLRENDNVIQVPHIPQRQVPADRQLHVLANGKHVDFAFAWVDNTGTEFTLFFTVDAVQWDDVRAFYPVLRWSNNPLTVLMDDAIAVRRAVQVITNNDPTAALAVDTWYTVASGNVVNYVVHKQVMDKLLGFELLRPFTDVEVAGVHAYAWPVYFNGLPDEELDPVTANCTHTVMLDDNGREPLWVNPLDNAYALSAAHGLLRDEPHKSWFTVDNYALVLNLASSVFSSNVVNAKTLHRGKWVELPRKVVPMAWAKCLCTVAPVALAACELRYGTKPSAPMLQNALTTVQCMYSCALSMCGQ